MTVASNTPYDQYSASNGQTIFTYNFEIVEQTDLLVYQRASSAAPNDVTDLLTLTTDYTVTGVGNEMGGTIVLVSGATTGDIVTVKQNVPVERDTTFTPGGVLKATDLNNEYDNQCLIDQVSRFNELSRMLSYWNSAVVVSLVDTRIPVLPASSTWWKNDANDEIEAYTLPAGGAAPAAATFLTLTDDTADMPNSYPLNGIGTGFMVNRPGTTDVITRSFLGTTGQIDITNPTGAAGNPVASIASNPQIPGLEGMGLPTGTTAQRPVTPIGTNLRYNTDLNSLEYHDSSAWVQLEDSTDITTLLAMLASHVAGQGASLIGLEDQGSVSSKFVQDLAEATFIAKTDNGTLVNAQFLSALATGFVGVTTTTGVLNSRVMTGTVNQIDVANGDASGTPTWSLSSTLNMPGTFNIQNTTAINAIINDSTLATATATNICTAAAMKAYIDSVAAGFTLINPVRVASTGNLISTYNNGASGIGATLTVTALGVASIDGVALSLNDRVLFKDQSTTYENGIYYVSDVGSGGTSAVYTRTTDFDQPSEIDPGDLVPVLAGATQIGTLWLQTATVTAVGTDPITFIQFAAAYTNVVTISGTQTITGDKTFSGAANAFGTPLSITLTNATGLPISTGVSGLGANVATFLATPSSANLLAALTDETGTGLAVFNNAPTFIAPVLGAASATSLTFSSTSGIIGTTTNDSAATGSVGEYVSSNVPVASSVAIANNTATNLTSISLTAGDWIVGGNVRITNTGQNLTRGFAWVSTTSATLPNVSNAFEYDGNLATFLTFSGSAPIQRISIAGTTTVYVSGQTIFGAGTASMCGNIWARRLR